MLPSARQNFLRILRGILSEPKNSAFARQCRELQRWFSACQRSGQFISLATKHTGHSVLHRLRQVTIRTRRHDMAMGAENFMQLAQLEVVPKDIDRITAKQGDASRTQQPVPIFL